MASKHRDIIVIGTSAGGLEALNALVGQLPSDLPSANFIVQHMAPQNTGFALLQRLGKYKSFGCKLADHGEKFQAGRIYIGPADHHLLVKEKHMLVTKGARQSIIAFRCLRWPDCLPSSLKSGRRRLSRSRNRYV
jgi:two-component system chemotaxis response regulator CheB